MPLVYCDHNFIVKANEESDLYKNHLRQLVTTGVVTFVLSPMHWVEAAEDKNVARGTAKADLMDSLQARWLYDRRGIQKREVADAFFRFAGVANGTSSMMGDVADVIADLVGQRAQRDNRAFVTHLRGIGLNHPLERSLRQAFESNKQNGARFRAGKFTPAIAKKIERLYIEQLLPTQTPNGLLLDPNTKNQFLTACQILDFPSIALENKVMYDNWKKARQLNRNNFMDQQHLMALPYVDVFITDDSKLRNLITRISVGLPFRTANPLKRAEFDLRYP